MGNVAEGVGEAKSLIDRYNAVCEAMGDPDADFDKLIDEQAALCRRRSTPSTPGRWTAPRDRDGRPAASAGRRRRLQALRRASAAGSPCAGCCSKSPTCSCWTSRPTTWTPSRWRWLERTLQDYPGTVVAVTHDRYFLDNVAGWILELHAGHGIPWEGNYSSWLDQKQARLALEEKADARRRQTLQRELEWIRHVAQGPPGEGQGPPQQLRAAGRRSRGRPGPVGQAGDHHPAGPPAGRPGGGGRTCSPRATATAC